MIEEIMQPTMTFTYVDHEGVVTTKEFTPSTWVSNLNEFVNFLRGCGYLVSNESIGVNTTKHPYIDYDSVYNLATFDL